MIGIGRSNKIEGPGVPRVEKSSKSGDKGDYPKKPTPELPAKQDTVKISPEAREKLRNKNSK